MMLRNNRCARDVHMSSQTHQDRKRYWATETPQVLSLIQKYREGKVVWVKC